ncbi:MAG: succinate dehydrogenase, hydrophobic membrane anchor protein [Gammaproteobacteria bacterium]|nr:succinate dehydrogenase, hydrophobic membrane anchor protein [Gammaproteobacteria bacterium]
MTSHTHGLRTWLLQRFSGVYLAVYLVYVIASAMRQGSYSYAEWHTWLVHPVMSIATAGFILAMLAHGWVGMRDVILDYVHGLGVRLLLLTLIALTLVACGLWALRVLLLAAG